MGNPKPKDLAHRFWATHGLLMGTHKTHGFQPVGRTDHILIIVNYMSVLFPHQYELVQSILTTSFSGTRPGIVAQDPNTVPAQVDSSESK